jgi:hypothetical protein
VQYWLTDLGGKTILDHAIEKVKAGVLDPRMAEKMVGHLTIGVRQASAARMADAANEAAHAN